MNSLMPFVEKRLSPSSSRLMLWGGFLLFGLCVTLHAEVSCTLEASGGVSVRGEGFGERVGDLVLHCHGGTPVASGTPLPTVNITVYLGVTVTSRLYSNGWSEALLLVDNPGSSLNYVPSTPLACNDPNGICQITGTGTGAGAYDGSPGRPNIFQGKVSGNAITFTSIPFDPPGAWVRMLRITNIRVNGSFGLGLGLEGIQANISIPGVSVNNAVKTVAYSNPTLDFSVRTPDNSAPSSGFVVTPCSTSGTQRIGVLRFASAFFSARSKTAFVDSDTSPTPVAQNLLTYDNSYDSESGLYFPSLTAPNGDFGTIGLANAGTRLKAVLNNIPPGTSVYTSVNRVDYANGNPMGASNGIVARMAQSEEGPFTPLTPAITLEGIPAVQLPVTNGTATAVWEVLRGDPFTLENADFPIWVLSAGNLPAAITVNGSYAPTPLSGGGVASSTLPLPRFVADAQVARSLFSVGVCSQPAFSISKSHTGNFTQYQMGATYNVVITNSGTGPTKGLVTVTETVPPGLTMVSMVGAGWTCAAGGTTCARTDALEAGTSYQPIIVTVNVASNAPSQVTNQVSVSGGGSAGANAADPTTIGAGTCPYSLNPSNASAASNGGTGMVSVIAAAGCSWAAVSDATSWLNVTSGTSGSGSGTVAYSFAANPNPTPRSATITVGAQRFILTQAGIAVAGLRFVPVTPCRIADTRSVTGPFGGPALGAGSNRDFAVPSSNCGIPASAAAYSLNVTVVPLGPLSYLSIWPTGQSQPLVSTLNSLDGRIKANAAIVPAGLNGALTVHVTDPTQVVLDINGYFVPASPVQNLAFYPVTPCRIADTRSPTGSFGGPSLAGGVSRTFPVPSSSCGIPATAQAYSLNMTVVPTSLLGFLSTWPAGSPQPLVSTLNALTGEITSNAAIVPAGVNGAISVYATNTTEVIIDINGYFAPPVAGALDFYTVTPCRVLDTRSTGGLLAGPIMGQRQSRSFPVPSSTCGIPGTAKAYSLNATVVPSDALSYLTLWGSGGMPFVSTLNSLDGTIVANAALVPAGTSGEVTAYTTDLSHLILDINGYFQ
jgi:uncharacterized repeat protein (TIGR01451 family)